MGSGTASGAVGSIPGLVSGSVDDLRSWLTPTPLATDGAPLRVTTALDLTAGTDHSPVLGETREVDGVLVREVTFVTENAGDIDVMVHLNGLTDNHRENVEPALLHRIAETPWYALTYLLPDDGTWGYRLVMRDRIPHDIGTERVGWVGIHADGRPDPLNPERLRHPHGEESSVLRMPGAPRRDEWVVADARLRPSGGTGMASGPAMPGGLWGHVAATEAATWRRLDLPELADAPGAVAAHHLPSGSPDSPLLVLFDAEQLVTMPLAAAMTRYHRDVDVLLIESGTSEQRGQTLPHPERVAQRVRTAIDALSVHTSRAWAPPDVIVSGVSYGGLAAAGLVIHHPEIAGRAIAQSGSFWFDVAHAGAPGRGMDEPGSLTRCVTDGRERPGRRIILHVGTDEGSMAEQTRMFAEAAENACIDVSVRQYRGGHDWAWWAHALFDGLDELLGG